MGTRRPKTVKVRDDSTTIEDKDKATAKGEFVGALVSVLCLYFVMYKTMSFVCCVYVFVYVVYVLECVFDQVNHPPGLTWPNINT